jgi:hypothetical protein
MALEINRTLADDASMATFEVVATDGIGETDTLIVDVSSLSGAAGDGTERVMISNIEAFISTTGGGGGPQPGAILSWDGGNDFLTLPSGVTTSSLCFRPSGGASGDILLTSPAAVVFTLRLTVKKIQGFALSMAQ